jgi:hypothetical protein
MIVDRRTFNSTRGHLHGAADVLKLAGGKMNFRGAARSRSVTALVLGFAPVACGPAGPTKAAHTPTVFAPGGGAEPGGGDEVAAAVTVAAPGGGAESVGGDQVAPTVTATAETIFEPISPYSKYDKVYVYTVEQTANEGRSLLHVAYPVTEHPAINARLAALADQFIEEFRAQSALQESANQDYVRKTGEAAASFVTQYVQHFDVTIPDANVISLAIERYQFMVGTGNTEVTGYVFDRTTGTELAPADLFESDAYLGRLSRLARERLERQAQSEAAREQWLAIRLEMIRLGTGPQAENFDGILLHEDGTLQIQFDKYQVAPGSHGVVTVSMPVDGVADLLTWNMRQLLGIAPAAPTPTPTAAPSSTPQPPPTHTRTPATPGPEAGPGAVDCAQVLCVAPTFDDGPSVYTEGLLDLLRDHDSRATFFVLGWSARVQSRTLARMAW